MRAEPGPGVFHGERATTDLDALAQHQHALVRGTHSAGAVRRSTTTTVMAIGETAGSASWNFDGSCTQPREDRYPGSPPACRATPPKASRHIQGIAALLHLLEW
jgi:hypothetical protein